MKPLYSPDAAVRLGWYPVKGERVLAPWFGAYGVAIVTKVPNVKMHSGILIGVRFETNDISTFIALAYLKPYTEGTC